MLRCVILNYVKLNVCEPSAEDNICTQNTEST